MEIKTIPRPWVKNTKQGTRYAPDPFYQSREWKQTRASFLASPPLIQLPPILSIPYQNKYCVECWKAGKIVDTHTVDHIKRKRADGEWTDHSNLQGLCSRHHAQKSATEKNELNDKKV